LTGTGRIFVDMDNTQAIASDSSRARNQARDRMSTAAVPAPVPQTRAESNDLRELLETHLLAMQALLEEHQRTLDRSLRRADSTPAEVLAELRSLGDHRAPWVKALAETRALLYVALQEIIVGDNDAGLSLTMVAMPEIEIIEISEAS
jgi:hypothetical protein